MNGLDAALPGAPTLSNGADQEKIATSNALNDEPGRSCEYRVNNHVDATKQKRHFVTLTNRLLEQDGKVVDNCVAATDLLHQLR